MQPNGFADLRLHHWGTAVPLEVWAVSHLLLAGKEVRLEMGSEHLGSFKDTGHCCDIRMHDRQPCVTPHVAHA